MKECRNCHAQYQDDLTVCPSCQIVLTAVPSGWNGLQDPNVRPAQVSAAAAAPAIDDMRYSERLRSRHRSPISLRPANYGMPAEEPPRPARRRRDSAAAPAQQTRRQQQVQQQVLPQTPPRQVSSFAGSRQQAASARPAVQSFAGAAGGFAGRPEPADVTAAAMAAAPAQQYPAGDPAGVQAAPAQQYAEAVNAAPPTDTGTFQRGRNADDRTVTRRPRQNLLQRGLRDGGTREQGIRSGGTRTAGIRPQRAGGINTAVAARFMRAVIPLAALIIALILVISNWATISAIAGQVLLCWIVSFVFTMFIARRFLQFESVMGISLALTVILMLIFYNVAGVGTGIMSLISAVMPCVIVIGAILWALRAMFR